MGWLMFRNLVVWRSRSWSYNVSIFFSSLKIVARNIFSGGVLGGVGGCKKWVFLMRGLFVVVWLFDWNGICWFKGGNSCTDAKFGRELVVIKGGIMAEE